MFRFTIREIVLITIIIAVAFGWWADRRELARLRSVDIRTYREILNSAAQLSAAVKSKLKVEIDSKPTGRFDVDGLPEYEYFFIPQN